MKKLLPPKYFLRFFRWFCHPKLRDFIEGDLMELYAERLKASGKAKADMKFIIDVLLLFRSAIIRPMEGYKHLTHYGMYKSYIKTGWRNLLRNKGYSLINIGGLATGMAVTILIGLWIWNECSFNRNFKNYSRVAQVWQFVTFDVEKSSYDVLPIPLAEELRAKYPDFESVSLSVSREVVLATGDKKLLKTGRYVESYFTEMMSLKMLAGLRNDLNDINAIMLSESLAKELFVEEDPLNKMLVVNENLNVKITGVYENFPVNSTFSNVMFLAPWNLFVSTDSYTSRSIHEWDENSFGIFVALKEGSDFETVSEKIRDIRMKRDDPPGYKPEFFLHPMSKWHLYSDFKNGVNTGGLITFVWLFGIIGIFVLILACINFMNLSTARSEKRAREVGLRKSIGSVRSQLILQFLCESLLTAVIGFILSLVLAQLILPFFNEVSGKQISILWNNPWFWLLGFAFSLITGLVAGSYPALYLSSFAPVKVLKGTFRPGRFAALPRKILVVLQFTVSITLMIGITVVFRQVEFARSRPVGYDRSSLIDIRISTTNLHEHYEALRNDLLNSGAVEEVAESMGTMADDYGGTTNLSWQGKNPETHPLFMACRVTHEFGKTIGWEVTEGRDFSRDHATDNGSMILNESAVKMMGFKKPTDELVRTGGKEYKVIGVVRDVIKDSPFKPVKPTFFVLDYESVNVISIRLAQKMSTAEALGKVEAIFKKYNPAVPFEYNFVDARYASKFSDETRIGKLAVFFASLAVFISCLGSFGLASFVTEQRTKEIGVRKVMGASVFNLWKMLSKDFILLVILSVCFSIPIAYYFMNNWLQNYEYRTSMSWWIFAVSALCALVITLFTVSYQSIKAAMANPIKSLRSE
jgi:ABC-type antimicrobial peptide transport system permease subunit